MTRAPTRSRSDVLQRIALAVLLGVVMPPPPAGAQIPSVRRRAQDAATRAVRVDTQPTCPAVAFDSNTVELTAARVDRLIKGLRARRDVLNGRRGAPSWNAMVTQRDAASNAAADLVTRKGPEMDAYRERRDSIARCRDEAFGEKRRARQQQSFQRAASDPDFMRQTAELSQRIMEAQQRGDTAAVTRLTKEANNLMYEPTREDTLAVDRHCGRLPPPPASVAQLDSLRALEDSLNAQLRQREQDADSAALGSGGANMTKGQLHLAQERTEMFLAKLASEGSLCGFSETEVTALKARRAELDELL
jgi:hypothetical protein